MEGKGSIQFVIELCGKSKWTEQISKGKGFYINEHTAERRVASHKKTTEMRNLSFERSKGKGKGKVIPLLARCGPEGG